MQGLSLYASFWNPHPTVDSHMSAKEKDHAAFFLDLDH